MKFCRNCGSSLAQAMPSGPPTGGPPMMGPPGPGMGPPGMGPPGMGPPGMAPPGMGPPGMAPPGMGPPSIGPGAGRGPGPGMTPGIGPGMAPGIGPGMGPGAGPPMGPPSAAGPSMGTPPIPAQGPLVAGPFPMPDGSGMSAQGPLPVMPTMVTEHRAGPPRPSTAPIVGASASCPRCGALAQPGFAYCQQCGLHLQGMPPPDPGPARVRPTAATPATGRPLTAGNAAVDPLIATVASDSLRPGAIPGLGGVAAPLGGPTGAVAATPATPTPRPQAGAAWGTAVLVNRDGSDGQRYPLVGEYLVVGRAGADIAFEEDRFLGRQHARLERGADGAIRIVPIETLNGVFRKADAPIELADGMHILVGREVLRFERVDPEEANLHPLVRHGVALFGSPPREPWGRLLQIVPNGGYRDVRHLAAEEVVLGREEGDIVFRDDAFMSRRHAALTWDGQHARLTDLGSSNGTFVRVTGPTPLKHGDHVRMGDQLLRIELGR